ncbi:MAG TPA: penicillin acylase family protein [Gemmatimonadaceae bacterium]
MKHLFALATTLSIIAAALAFGSPASARAQLPAPDTLRAPGLRQPVEIVRDRRGIAHIYAANEHDLFFAQGYNAAHDRLFQLELWRRQATGTVAEVLGPREIERDIGTRLFMYRGSMDRELASYHPRGAAIIGAFVDGINAYIDRVERDSTLLPIELRLLGIEPGKWTPAVVISRHQGLLGNIGEELSTGRAVAQLGAPEVKKLSWFHPGDPVIALDTAIDGSLLSQDILGVYNAFRRGIRFLPQDVAAAYQGDSAALTRLALVSDSLAADQRWRERRDIGSNNWVVSGRLTQGGHAIMANDPHRAQAAPSLRYWVHLVAPGWNVIGGGEPEIPGVSIGHNEHGAWGLTIFGTDGEDLYVYHTDPSNPLRYRYRGAWESMRVITDTIPVKGRSPAVVKLAYTRHGPVVFEDSTHHVAYAVRAAWLEPGSAPYLASLRIAQARNWAEFRDACSYSNIPGENMVWADTAGHIGWQAVGIAPIRRNWSGLVPVPGDGRYEWDGYFPIKEKPHIYDPPAGYFATANNDLIPPAYPHRDAVGWSWADPFRWARISEVLASGSKLTMMDMERLQTDYLSIPARTLVPLLAELTASDPKVERARQMLVDWNYVLDKNSVAAGIYEAWQRRLDDSVTATFVPASAQRVMRGVQLKRVIDWLLAPSGEFGAHPVAGRDTLLLTTLAQAVDDLEKKLGPDMSRWQYGQPKYKHALIHHPLTNAVSDDVRSKLDVGPLPRGGDSYTVGATGGGDNQTSGASFRIIANTGDWDSSVGSNTPGQSGDPDNPHYSDLFQLWARDKYFPVAYTRARVESVAESVTVLEPVGRKQKAESRKQ